jgi:hypothetical protein
LTKQQQQDGGVADRSANKASRFIPADAFAKKMTVGLPRRPSSIHIPSVVIPPLSRDAHFAEFVD